MKLLYITNGINGSGGLERVLSLKASLLAENYGYEVSILVLNDSDKAPFYNFSSRIRFYSIEVGGNPIGYVLSYKNGIQRVINEIKPNIISVCDDGLKGFFIPQFVRTKAKIIYERHVSKLAETNSNQSILQKASTRIKWLLMEMLGKKFDSFVVLTEGNKKEWGSLRNIEVVPNPLSFYPEMSSHLDNKKVICVGKISFQKGQDLLLKAWKNITQQFPDWTLELYGKENRNFLDTSTLPENVSWYPPAKNIKEKYLASSIYVMSSRFEGFGMVLIEAMACGVPCISFNCNYGPSDIISDGIDGFLVQKENVDELSRKIEYLIENREKRIEFGKSAKQNVKRFSPQMIVEQWNNLFKNL
ncbi:glycosyltransferase family 4 protein [Epilithonimonas ginsengisoli]|uniref:Glycosyltransferase family 4 protein n=1 Tax=Epilithonimonas ginsengisoli TaxID=1245592 RepID=A0ABU4JIX3_9FLAO|nr:MULTISPECIES: glycosyltransferase family 4 protein [Chryseobacterium group]MBV6879078.1 glycosyltransferase family 4 protein [Epilithonimonas sp. FP105]MDW8549513.1 glycosyltransferase family 4 protein [Epilithonimonas ginsengisoli]OAH74377.1 hypothetical protein AXA65_06345 [Chryseobacterium sp. FP211-J200]